MIDSEDKNLNLYLSSANSWHQDKETMALRERKLLLALAALLGVIALAEAFALIMLSPLKTVVPYTLLVDKHTGYVEQIKPLDQQMIAPDKALTRSFLAQYVLSRESFDINSVTSEYQKVALWSGKQNRQAYIAMMQKNNPESPLVKYPRRAVLNTQIKSISSLGKDTALVRFDTWRSDPGAPPTRSAWQAVLAYRFAGEPMSAEDRLTNPLGFQVTSYRKTVEILPDAQLTGPAVEAPPAQTRYRRPAPVNAANNAVMLQAVPQQ